MTGYYYRSQELLPIINLHKARVKKFINKQKSFAYCEITLLSSSLYTVGIFLMSSTKIIVLYIEPIV